MNKKNAAARFWQYIAECARLLYWAYLKPFTLDRWLKDIHPKLDRKSNPFAMRAEFPSNPRLDRYAGQVWWLSATVPLLVVLLVGPLYSLAAREAFDWLNSTLFLLGWFAGLLLIPMHKNWRIFWFLTLLALGLLLAIGSSFAPEVMDSVRQASSSSLILAAVVQVAWGVAWGVALGVALGIALSVASCVVWSLAFGVASLFLNIASIVVLILAPFIASSVALIVVWIGVLSVAWSVALGVTMIIGVLRVWFWVPELLWTTALFLLSRYISASSLLRYLPPHFDELIRLPLPFMDILIADAYRDNSAAARQTIDYLIASTNQQSLAARAMAFIAVDSLSRCQTLGDIAAIADQLAWIPSPPPPEVGPVLPQFLEIGQIARSAANATSTYRKIESLDSLITALSRLRDSLAFSKNGALAARFGSAAERWLGILQTARRTLEQESRDSPEIPEVYIAGPALHPESAKNRFKGRRDIFREIETVALSSQPPVLLLYGGRRTGKTSALKYLPQKVGGDLVPLLVDMQGGATGTKLHSLAEYLAEEIIEAARKSRNLHLPYPDERDLASDPFPALKKWFQQVERTAPGKRFLLCLDEFERLSEVVRATGSRAPLDFLRHVLQHRQQWILLFSGSHTLEELDDYWSDYLINTRSLRVTYLQEEEARDLIREPVEEFPDIYEPEAVDRIIWLTRCQPYLVQLTCFALVEELNRKAAGTDARATKATAADVEAIIPKVLETGGVYFRELWRRRITIEQRRAIGRLVNGEEPAPEDSWAWRKLEQKEVLEVGPGGERRFQVPLVQQFIENIAIKEM